MTCPRNILLISLHHWSKWEDIERTNVIDASIVEHARANNISVGSLNGDIRIKQIRRCELCNMAQLRSVRT